MKMIILDAAKQNELTALNAAGDPARRLCPLPLTSGDAALTAALLTDSGPGQTWEHYGEFLKALPMVEVDSKQIVEPQIA